MKLLNEETNKRMFSSGAVPQAGEILNCQNNCCYSPLGSLDVGKVGKLFIFQHGVRSGQH